MRMTNEQQQKKNEQKRKRDKNKYEYGIRKIQSEKCARCHGCFDSIRENVDFMLW